MKFIKNSFIFICFVLSSVIGLACYCGGKKGISQEIKLRDVIVIGKILSKDSIMLVDSATLKANEKFKDVIRESGMVYFPLAKYIVEVDTAFKGNTIDTITIYTHLGYDNCGMQRMVDSTYIFYLNHNHQVSNKSHILPNDENIFWILNCTRTTLINQLERKKLIKALK